MFLLTLNRFSNNTETSLISSVGVFIIFIISWTNISTRFHFLLVVYKSLNCRTEKLQSFRFTLRYERRILSRFKVCSWPWCIITITITLNNIFYTTTCWHSLSMRVVAISSMSSSCCHYSLFALFFLLNSFAIFLIC